MVQITHLICTYIYIYLPNRRIAIIPASIFVYTFPGILVQTWCKSANMRAVAPIVGLIVQPDRDLCRSGPVGLVIECNVLLPQEVCHVVSPVHCCLRDAEIEFSAIHPRDPGGRYRPGASGGRQRGQRKVYLLN